MAYLTQEQLEKMNFQSLGKNVKISDKTSIYCPESISIGDNSRIEDLCLIKGPLIIGRYVHIPPFCLLSATKEPIIIGDFSTLAYKVSIFTSTDDYSGESMVNSLIPEAYKKVSHGIVDIRQHVIIGTGSVIMPGVSIGEGCSFGAMTFVNKSTAPWGVYAGIPAKRIKDRKKDLLKYESEFLKTI